jgi:hypothetical protein
MAKVKKKLTAVQKRARKKAKSERQRKYMWVFMNGRQVRLKRPPTIDGLPAEEFAIRNADPIWLHQHEMWEYIEVNPDPFWASQNTTKERIETERIEGEQEGEDIPF